MNVMGIMQQIMSNNRVMADRILCHELVHVYSFSYGCDIDIETEEIIADFMSLYGRNIVYTADKIFDLLEWKYG